MTDEIKKEIINGLMNVEFVPELVNEEHPSNESIQFPIDKIASLGVAFEPLADAFMHITQGGEYVSGLAKVTIPKGTHLAYSVDKGANIGTALSDTTNMISGQAGITPLVCNPTMMFAAMALMSVNKKLDTIQEGQQEIFEILMDEKKAEQRANLNVLTDVLNNYKYNWNSERYKDANYIKVLDIRQKAEEHIIFHRRRIENSLDKKTFLSADKKVEKKSLKLKDDFHEYHLALYLYSFAMFLEIMLLENFDKGFLDKGTEKIRDYIFQYKELYNESYSQLESESRKSLEGLLLRGVSKAGTGAGEFATKLPLLNKIPINDTLIWAGEKAGELNEGRQQQIMENIFDTQAVIVQPFIENIENINKLYNTPTVLYLDRENVYIDSQETS